MILTVEVKPNAHETRVVAWKDARTVVVAVAAPPAEGKANTELVRFLAKQLNIAKSLIEIKRGAGGRVKHLALPDETRLDALQ